MRLEVSRYFVWTSRPSSGDVIKNLIINIRSPKMIPVLFRGEPESNPWNDNWNRRWKFTNVVHFTPSKILGRHHCHPYRHYHQQQHHSHFSSSSWSLALEPYLSRWAPFDFFLPVIDIEGALVSTGAPGFYEYCKRKKYHVHFHIVHFTDSVQNEPVHQNTVTLGLVSGGGVACSGWAPGESGIN